MAKRFCFINPKNGNVKVVLTVNNGLISGADFIIIDDPDNTKPVVLNWKMKTGDDGTDTFVIEKITPENLIDNDMAWEILTCCAIPGSDSGNLKIELFQNEIIGELSIPINKDLTGLPQCGDGEAQPFNGRLRFASV